MIGIRLANASIRGIPVATKAAVPEPNSEPEQKSRTEAHETIDTGDAHLRVYGRGWADFLCDYDRNARPLFHGYLKGFPIEERRHQPVRQRQLFSRERSPVGEVNAKTHVIVGYVLPISLFHLQYLGRSGCPRHFGRVQVIGDLPLMHRQAKEQKWNEPRNSRDPLEEGAIHG